MGEYATASVLHFYPRTFFALVVVHVVFFSFVFWGVVFVLVSLYRSIGLAVGAHASCLMRLLV